jgi:hypothetical protein
MNKRTYRFCSPKEVKNNWGKLCYRFCAERTIVLKKCKKKTLIIEDLTNQETYNKFLNAEFMISVRKSIFKKL